MEAEYLRRTVGPCLGEGLAEIATKRPSDPVEYLAQWLLKHKQNILNQKQADTDETTSPPPLAKPGEEVVAEETVKATSDGPKQPTEGESQGKPQQMVTDAEESPSQPPPPAGLDVERPSSKLSRIEEEKEEEVDREMGATQKQGQDDHQEPQESPTPEQTEQTETQPTEQTEDQT